MFHWKFLWILITIGFIPSTKSEADYSLNLEKCEKLTDCACYDYDILVGLDCENVSNFEHVSEILSDGSVFEVNTTYEITLSGMTLLPARSLKGLIIFRLFLDDPKTVEIAEQAFNGIIRLRILHIRQSAIQRIPDFKIIKHSLRHIIFENSRLTALEGTGLQDLDLIESMFFSNNSITRIDADVFKGTNGVLLFDVSHNRLRYLPPNLFNEWKNLRKVVLSYNQLLHVNEVFAITHPRFIYLDFNNLTDLDAILHPNMESVNTLLLASNPLENVSEDSFNGKVPNIRFLYIDNCLIREFDVRHYQTLDSLVVLDLSYNRISKVPMQVVDFGMNLEIDLFGNQITEFEAEVTYKVKRFYIQDNLLSALGQTIQFSQIFEGSFARNRLEYLSQEDFRGVHGMVAVELQSNKIQWIDTLTFRTIRNDLHYLDLSDNLITSLNGSVRFLSQLNALNLSHNFIQSFQEGEFIGLNELAELYLQYNRLVELGGQLQQVPELQYLVISHNRVQSITSEQVPRKLQYLYLEDNPFRCDCRLLPFLHWLNTTESPGTDVSLCSPQEIALNSSEESLRNKGAGNPCPKPCSCFCTEDKGEYFMTLDCSAKNMTFLPSFLSKWSNQSFEPIDPQLLIQQERDQHGEPKYQSVLIYDRVLGINLENNSFRSLSNIRLPARLQHFKVANNFLRRVPDSLLHSRKLKHVTLSGNPWECNCEATGFKKWLLQLSKTDVVKDINETLCSAGGTEDSYLDGRIIYSLSDLDLCPVSIVYYIFFALALTFLLLCSALALAYTRYERKVNGWLYNHGFTFMDKDKKYEAFISFSYEDFNVVYEHFIRTIEERKPQVRLYLNYRDFLGGRKIEDNIRTAVEESKRTVLLVSRNFLNSVWCLQEFEIAHAQSIEDRIDRIILIKLGDLPADIPDNIKEYMKTTTYLTFGSPMFWTNLFAIFDKII